MNRVFISMLYQKHSYLNLTSKSFHTTTMVLNQAKTKTIQSKLKKMSKKGVLEAISVKPSMTIKELADAMDRPTSHVIACLDKINYAQSANKRDSFRINNLDIIIKVVQITGFRHRLEESKTVDFDQLEEDLRSKDDRISKRPRPKANELVKRSPVVTIMGHVDHGKTTLLDSLRGSNVVEKEFGGITQHIGAFNVSLSKDKNITFLDTPGHAAFSMMRSRGARLTDIVVLVIAAEDGVMNQTIESINHAKSTACPIIVAINKIDKCSANQIENIKKELLKHELIAEEMGGEVQVVPISALKKTNLDRLKEEIWTRAEIMELKGDPKGLVEGYVVESTQDLHRGKLATVLIVRGELKKGDYLVAGNSWCKVKYIFDENARIVNKAGLSQAVQVVGWKELPNAGDEVLQMVSEIRAKEIVEVRSKIETLYKQKNDLDAIKLKRSEHDREYKINLREKIRINITNNPHLSDQMKELMMNNLNKQASMGQKEPGQAHESNIDLTRNKNSDIVVENKLKKNCLPIIIKADVDGSLEAILNVIETYDSHDKVYLDLISFEVGPVKKSDLELAETFNAIIYCFNLPQQQVDSSTNDKKIRVKHHNVIYKLFDDLLKEINELAPLVEQKENVGQADIARTFDYAKTNSETILVTGGKCTDGYLDRKLYFSLMRNDTIICEKQKCQSLKHLKNDVNTIKANVEFGLVFENQKDIIPKPGDKLICYDIKMVKSKIDWNLGF